MQPFPQTCTNNYAVVLYQRSVTRRLLQLLRSIFGNFNHGVCHVIKMGIAEINLDMEVLMQQQKSFNKIQTHKGLKTKQTTTTKTRCL